MKKNILILFGGVSSEHEVSIITGLQIIENIDHELYTPIALYISKDGEFLLMPKLKNKKDFFKSNRIKCSFKHNEEGSYIEYGISHKKIYIYSAYLALHGGLGEGGQLQGLLECFSFAYTSPDFESSAICMNKCITKEILASYKIPTISGLSVKDYEFKQNPKYLITKIKRDLGLPAIIKPAHLGSTIGINVAHDEIELEKYLSAAVLVDKEVLVEKYLNNITEYNISLRTINNEVIFSEIEKPMRKSDILTFADKYANGAKKTGGMASLDRELPAKISPLLEARIKELAKQTYEALRCTEMVRIDFIESDSKLYLCEVNQIPGSMAFYLWEAEGIQFKDQITMDIEESIKRRDNVLSKRFSYSTDIVDKFISA